MAAKANIIGTTDIQVTARELDFVTRFERNWQHLREILGIMRPIKKQPGAVLKSKYAEGTLEDGAVGEGEDIPYSKFTVKEKKYQEMTIEKYAKGWRFERISLVASAIMRVAMYEILYMADIPQGAAISEAVEIAKKYETPEVAKFINGILGSFARGEVKEKD